MVVQKSNGWVENFESLSKHKVSEIGLKPNEDKKIRIVCISDTHSAVENVELPFKIPDGDILIHAGDFTNYGEVDKVKEFNAWLGTLSHTYKIVVAGNRDISFDSSVVGPDNIFWDKFKHPEINKVKSFLTNCIYLEDTSVTIEGLKIYGTPHTYQVDKGSKAFQIPPTDVKRWEEVWSKIPSDTDILVSHSPPYGIQDANDGGERCGSESLLKHVVERVKPIYHIFGHIHEAYGMATNGVTTFVNAAASATQRPGVVQNQPFVFDLQLS